MNVETLDLFLLEDVVWLATQPIGLESYDFHFERFFACRRPWQRPAVIHAVGRFGVVANYAEVYQELYNAGIQLLHTPDQYSLASQLTDWYPLLKAMTPYSVWFAEPPSVAEVERFLQWPIFVKANRQTSRHRAALSIVKSPDEYQTVADFYRHDPVLQRQAIVLREFVPLRNIAAPATDKIAPSFEFRTFWWKGHCVGLGAYWAAFASYRWTREEEQQALSLAQQAANCVDVPFLVIDVAQTATGAWIVIECNDAQESGYAGISPIALWQKIVALERSNLAGS